MAKIKNHEGDKEMAFQGLDFTIFQRLLNNCNNDNNS